MIDRSTPPKIEQITTIKLPEVHAYQLDNGIPLYEITTGKQDVVRFEVVFNAGRPFEIEPLVAKASCELLKDGTRTITGAAIADQLDYTGSALDFPFQMDTANIALFTISRHFDTLLPMVYKVVSNPIYAESELRAFKTRYKNNLKIDLTKNEIVAYRKVTEMIFGTNHPYGYNSSADSIDTLERQIILNHHQRCYTARNCQLFLSGKTTPQMIKQINQLFGHLPTGTAQKPQFPIVEALGGETVFISNGESIQTSIRIGRRMFNQHHPDYPGMLLLNTILGGFFGSRLMTNIREEKGYTYHIFSALDHFVHDGYFYIGAEVGNDFVEATLREIQYEMERLKTELIDQEELQMVKNYLLGTYLSAVDGPFNVSEVIRNLIIEDLSTNYFNPFIHQIKQITNTDLQRLAKEYFDWQQLFKVIVGN